MTKRYFSSTQFFFASNNSQKFGGFSSAAPKSRDFIFNGVKVMSRPTARPGRTLPGADGVTLEFRDFATSDEAYKFCRDFMNTLAARIGSQGIAITYSISRHDDDSVLDLWQLMPGINVRNVLGLPFNSMTMSGVAVSQYPLTPGDWLHEVMEGAPVLVGDSLEPALNAYGIACSSDAPEAMLVNFFAALECLAGDSLADENLIERIDRLQQKMAEDKNYTDEERSLLIILDDKKKISRKKAVERLLSRSEATPGLAKDLNLAYKARGKYVHYALTHDRLSEITTFVGKLVVKAFGQVVRDARDAERS